MSKTSATKVKIEGTGKREELAERERPERWAQGGPYGSSYADILALQRSAGNRAVSNLLEHSGNRPAAGAGSVPPIVEEVLESDGGQPLDSGTRAFMEERLGRGFSGVRVHTGAKADESARAINAAAYTVSGDIVFAEGKYSPGTLRGTTLLAHELAHVMQQGDQSHTYLPHEVAAPGTQLEHSAKGVASAVMSGLALPTPGMIHAGAVQMSPAGDLIDEHTALLNLDETKLGTTLLHLIEQGGYVLVEQVFDELGSMNRDDVALELVSQADDAILDVMARVEAGRRLLDRLFDELTAGKASDEEIAKADRIIQAKSRLISPAEYQRGVLKAKIFPFKLPGLTVFHPAPITARRKGKGKIWVRYPVNVYTSGEYGEDIRTLPLQVFTSSGLELPENEIVKIKLYDEGEAIIERPALYLIQMSNVTTTTTLEKIAETMALGASLGGGAVVGAGARVAGTARFFLWSDRVAGALGALTSILAEHRGWIIKKWGEPGRTFLHHVDVVNRALLIYGGLTQVGKLLILLKASYQKWRSARAAARTIEESLSDTERGVIQQVDNQAEGLIKNADEVAETKASQHGGSPNKPSTGKQAGHDALELPEAEPEVPLESPLESIGRTDLDKQSSVGKIPTQSRALDFDDTVNEAMELERFERTGDVSTRRIRGLDTGRAKPGRDVAPGTLKELEPTLQKPTGRPGQREVTHEEQLFGVPGDETWSQRRASTPSPEVKTSARYNARASEFPVVEGQPDPAFPSLTVTGSPQADHIVSVDRIRRMPGFAQLDETRQIQVLNIKENFIPLSPTANPSKGALSFEKWTKHKALNLLVDQRFRQRMIALEAELEPLVQEKINTLLREQMSEK